MYPYLQTEVKLLKVFWHWWLIKRDKSEDINVRKDKRLIIITDKSVSANIDLDSLLCHAEANRSSLQTVIKDSIGEHGGSYNMRLRKPGMSADVFNLLCKCR